MKQLILLLSLLFISQAFAGQGRDGGWPESIQVLRLAKLNLIELIRQATDQDIKDSINGMKDRDEAIKPEDVNKELLIDMVNRLQNPDVEQIEKSTYNGVRLFFYNNEDPANIQIYATKNFFNLEKYQIKLSDLNASIIRDVQTLILHEISHLWGYGEESGELNYARTFAVRLVNILHGSMKLNFTNEEKLQSLTQAYNRETRDIMDIHAETQINDLPYSCLEISRKEELRDSKTFKFDPWGHDPDGYVVKGTSGSSIARMTIDGFILLETSSWGFGAAGIKSTYMEKKGANREVIAETICHRDEKKVNDYIDRFVRPYYTRSNLLTDLDNSSTVVYQSLLIQNLNFLADTLKSSTDVQKANQLQNIKNVDFKIKVQNKEVYERLTSRSYKYSKDKDTKDLAYLNSFLNTDLSTGGSPLFAQISIKVKQINAVIKAMKNVNRQIHLDSFMSGFLKEFNKIVDRTQEFEDNNDHNINKCYEEKKVGKFYACQLEITKTDALGRIQMYEKMDTDLRATVKVWTNKALEYKD